MFASSRKRGITGLAAQRNCDDIDRKWTVAMRPWRCRGALHCFCRCRAPETLDTPAPASDVENGKETRVDSAQLISTVLAELSSLSKHLTEARLTTVNGHRLSASRVISMHWPYANHHSSLVLHSIRHSSDFLSLAPGCQLPRLMTLQYVTWNDREMLFYAKIYFLLRLDWISLPKFRKQLGLRKSDILNTVGDENITQEH